MIMRYQFYPWTHRDLAREISEKLGLPVDAPRRIADGTMQRFENWVASPEKYPVDIARGQRRWRRFGSRWSGVRQRGRRRNLGMERVANLSEFAQ